MSRILLEPAYVLHSRSFRETSLIVESFTREHGRVAMVARGARSARSKWRNVLQPFRPLLLSWNQKSDLGTLTAADQVASPPALQGESLYCGLYVNELLMRLLHRGDPMQRRDVVAPAIPKVLGDLGLSVDEPEQQRRLELARHLTSPDHPLTARVIVNRVWHHHFGAGLVDTPSDFGHMGSRPTHPQLLDWLAADFIENGWSLKRLHRTILLSTTFRQSSRPQEDAMRVDADSRLLWRYPPRRLEAEAIRDSILAASGKLSFEMGGPGFDLFKQRGGLSDYTAIETFDSSGWRRMIYAHKIRMQSVDIFGAFDCPDAGQMKPKRTQSITPTQSFGLFNSPLIIRQAGFFADRIRSEVGEETVDQVDRAFVIALSRRPSDSERSRMIELVEAEGLPQLCRVLMNTSEFIYIQ